MIRRLLALLVFLLPACASTGSVVSPSASAPNDTVVETTHGRHAGHDPGLRASPPAPALASPMVVPLDAATLAALPRETFTATVHERTLQCEGVSLTALLRSSKAMPAEPLRGARLASYVLVTARDGDRAVYSLAELDPTLGNRKVLLVDRCDGEPLDEQDGPLRLIAPEEAQPARWVRQVQSIAVVAAP